MEFGPEYIRRRWVTMSAEIRSTMRATRGDGNVGGNKLRAQNESESKIRGEIKAGCKSHNTGRRKADTKVDNLD